MTSPEQQKIKQERVLLQGTRFDVHALYVIGDDGKTYTREVIRHPGAVVLLPLLDADTVVLIENTRSTVAETLLELPAGTREPDEPAMETASRELIEETGYRAGHLKLIHEFYSAPGISDEWMHLYLATGLTPGPHQREATEQITNRPASRTDIIQWMATGRIRDAKTLIGLYAFLFSPVVSSWFVK